MITTAISDTPQRGLRGVIHRRPYLALLLIFNTIGQGVAFVPVIALRRYGVALNVDLFVIVPTLLFLLLPALVITRIARGRDGLRALGRAMVRFRVRPWWYLLPLVAVPGLTVVTALPAPPDLTAQRVIVTYLLGYLPALLFQFLTTNWWEETVWTGFFQAPLQARLGAWRAVLVTTPFFALEHISLVFGGTFSDGVLQLGLLLLVILPTRALLGWVYNRTGSLPLVGLVHASSNASGLALVPQLFHQIGGGGSALLLLGVVVIVATRGRLGWGDSRRTDVVASRSDPASTPAPTCS